MGFQHVREVAAFGLDRGGVDVAHLADRGRQPVVGRHPGGARRRLLQIALPEFRIAVDVGARRPLPGAAEPGEPLLEIEKEGVVLLLAVVADVDAGLHLLRHDRAQRVEARGGDFARAERLAAGPLHIESVEMLGARQAAGVGGEDAFGAAFHGRADCIISADGPSRSAIAPAACRSFFAACLVQGFLDQRACQFDRFPAELNG